MVKIMFSYEVPNIKIILISNLKQFQPGIMVHTLGLNSQETLI